MKDFLTKHLEVFVTILMFITFVLACVAAYLAGYESAENHYKKIIAEANEVHARALADAETAYRKLENDHAAELSRIDKKHLERLKNVQAKNKTDIAAVYSGTLRLHERFACADTTAGLSATGTGSGLGDGRSTAGLRVADAEFLVSESDRADALVIRLHACQDIIRADRSFLKER